MVINMIQMTHKKFMKNKVQDILFIMNYFLYKLPNNLWKKFQWNSKFSWTIFC